MVVGLCESMGVVDKAGRRLEALGQVWARRAKTRHIHGPRRLELQDDEVMVTALVKDAEYFISRFIAHHLQLGARHVLLVDNGSTDRTIEIARSFPNVTIVRNALPAKQHEIYLRREMSALVAKGGWILFADADELVEMPLLSSPSALGRLVSYCNARDFTAVVGQMLDRYSDESYSRLRGLSYDEAIEALDLYSIDDVDSIDYHDTNKVPFSYFLAQNRCEDPLVKIKSGGIRSRLFGERPFLSKHSLVRNRPGIQLMSHPHCASGVSISDVTLLLHHYKLAGDWVARDARSVQKGTWRHGEDERRLAAVGKSDDFRLEPSRPKQWTGVTELTTQGFLYASPAFTTSMSVL